MGNLRNKNWRTETRKTTFEFNGVFSPRGAACYVDSVKEGGALKGFYKKVGGCIVLFWLIWIFILFFWFSQPWLFLYNLIGAVASFLLYGISIYVSKRFKREHLFRKIGFAFFGLVFIGAVGISSYGLYESQFTDLDLNYDQAQPLTLGKAVDVSMDGETKQLFKITPNEDGKLHMIFKFPNAKVARNTFFQIYSESGKRLGVFKDATYYGKDVELNAPQSIKLIPIDIERGESVYLYVEAVSPITVKAFVR